jgi:ketosteroid isomerase-like protein
MPDGTDTVRRFFGAWSAGDLDAMLAVVDDGVVVLPVLEPLFEQPSYHGRDGVAAAFREIAARWDRFEPRVEDTGQAGDQVIAFLHLVLEARGRSSDARLAVVCHVRDGLITSLESHDAGSTREHLGS